MVQSSYSVKITPKASEDLDGIYRYIANELVNEDAAENLMVKIENGVMRLSEFPLSCNLVADEILRDKGYRRLIIGNYVVFYLVDKARQRVVIMRVLYGRQEYQDIL